MKITHYCWPALLLVCLGGCFQVKESVDSCAVNCRNRCYAERAWLACKSNYDEQEFKADFGKGFRDGYVAVASGGSMCQPALPPRCYWHFEYQNPDGQQRMLAWFNGYSYGALNAEQEGINDWSRIVTAPTLPPYRKKRPANIPPLPNSDYPSEGPHTYPNRSPQDLPEVEPAPLDDRDSAHANMIEPEEPVDEDKRQAEAAAVQWTNAADAY